MSADPARHREDDDPLATADEMLQPSANRTISPTGGDMEGAPGRPVTDDEIEGQLGPDEISDPDEVIRNHDAKAHS